MAIFIERLLLDYWEALSKLPYCVGQDTVQSHLEELALAAFAFYYKAEPMRAALFAEPELLERYRKALKSQAEARNQSRPAPLLAAYLGQNSGWVACGSRQFYDCC